MYIDIYWSNLNSDQVTLELFRHTEKITKDNIEELEPIVTFTDGTEFYRDTDVQAGKEYFYVFVTSNEFDTTRSINYPVVAVNQRGIGPQTVLDGDLTLGYMGEVESSRLINTQEFVNILEMEGVTISNPFPTWHKFVRNNKIHWVPNAPLCSNVGYDWLYQQGLVYGIDGESTNPFTEGVEQNRTIKIGLDTYKVRLMNGIQDGDWTELDRVNYKHNEFTDFVFPLMHSVPDTQRLNNVLLNGQYIRDVFGTAAAHKILVQEPISNTECVTRGYGANVYDYAANYTSYYETRTYTTNRTLRNTSHLWWPVLELIED